MKKLFALLILAWPAHGLTVTADLDSVTVRDLAPRSTVAYMAILVEPYNSTVMRTLVKGTATDDDADGIITLSKDGVPEASIWAVASINDGATAFASPRADLISRMETGPETRAGGAAQIARNWVVALLIRPGEGAWFRQLTEGGPDDSDRSFNGHIVVESHNFTPLSSSQAPSGLRAGDVFLIIDWETLEHTTFTVGR